MNFVYFIFSFGLYLLAVVFYGLFVFNSAGLGLEFMFVSFWVGPVLKGRVARVLSFFCLSLSFCLESTSRCSNFLMKSMLML